MDWKTVNLPHDWVVDLPYAKEASHSHGYKAVGYKFPENSVGDVYKRQVYLLNDDGKVVNKFSGKNIDGYFDFQKSNFKSEMCIRDRS